LNSRATAAVDTDAAAGKIGAVMNYDTYDRPFIVAEAPAPARAAFYRKAYLTAAGAFAAWAVVLSALFAFGAAAPLMRLMVGAGQLGWLLVLGLFWVATFFGQKLAFSLDSTTQYLGLALYVVAEAVIFVPLIGYTLVFAGGENAGQMLANAFSVILGPALIATSALFAALVTTVFLTKFDFSILKAFVIFGSFGALGIIVVAALFGFSIGTWFAFAMVAVMAAAILWQTWQIKNQFDTTQHVGAATMIFAGFMTLLYYVISIFLSRRN
jgi:FtsH-binding integral membrane protein